MEDFLLRISTINLNENIKLMQKMLLIDSNDEKEIGNINSNINNINTNNTNTNSNIYSKFYYLEISEELERFNLNTRYTALTKLLFSFIKNTNFNFLLHDNLEENFNLKSIEKANEFNLLPDLIKNLTYFLTKFSEFPKEVLSIKKSKLILFMKINILLIFFILFFLKRKRDIKNFIKNLGDDLEDIILRLFKLSPVYKYIPNRSLMCLHYIYIKILTSDDNDEIEYTCRKIEKKHKYLNKSNLDKLLKPDIPKLFYDYEKHNNFIEKFYKKNMLKRDKSETERTVIVNILKVLLSTTDNANNLNSGEYIKEYIPEIILYHYYVSNRNPFQANFCSKNIDLDKESIEINSKYYSELLSTLPQLDRDFYAIIELIHKVSLTSIIICFYFNILKSLQAYDLIQYTVFSFHLIDSNGLLVFLKILNQDYKAIEQQFINIYDTDVINLQFGLLIELILLNNLKLIFKICYKNDDFILKYLIECKLHIMLRKVLNNFNENEKIKKYCLKLFKCQLKFYDKNWRVDNVNIITSIYLTLKIKPEIEGVDNYLKYDKRDKNSKEWNPDYFTFEELKKIHADYHFYNYTRFLNSGEEYEKYQNSTYQSLYANLYMKMWNSVTLEEDFTNSYK